MAHRGVLLLAALCLALTGQCATRLTPRTSFPKGSPWRPLACFYRPDVSNTTTLLLSDDGDTLFVGARDAVLSLDVSQKDTIVMRRRLDWSPSEEDLEQCHINKGKKMMDCPNFIRVLQFLNTTHMYACGTYAFSPICTYMHTDTLLMTSPSGKPEEGRGRCPYDPYQRNTAITVDGELYTSTVADYMGNRPVISRHLGEGSHVDLKLDDTLGWLEDPTFISSSYISSEEKVYFFFSEVGREYDFFDKCIASRVAQVCTSDVGGQRTLQRRWTTFAKAQLLCQSDTELPYNVVQDMITLPPPEGKHADDTLFYGIFTSQWSVNSGLSAVCAFRLGDIKAVFSKNYKVLNRDTLRWSARVQEKIANPGECGLHNASDNILRFVKENFLAEESVMPVGRRLTMLSHDQRYRHLTAQRVWGTEHREYVVLFLLTESGYLHKAVMLDKGTHIIEEVQVFEHPQPVMNVQLSLSKGVVFVGTSEGVVSVPVANCSFYSSCAQCVLARDPFCAWHHDGKACVEVSLFQAGLGQDVDNGDVGRTCRTTQLIPRARFGPDNLPTASCPPGQQVSVTLNEVVRLRCPISSGHAQRLWERPNSRISSDLYLRKEDGSLSFVVTAATLGTYLCLSTENGFQQTLAIYQVMQKSRAPQNLATTAATTTVTRPQTRPLPTKRTSIKPARELATSIGIWPKTSTEVKRQTSATPVSSQTPVTTKQGDNFSMWAESESRGFELKDGDHQLLARGPSYLKELVVVSVLLALCLSVLLTMVLYGIRKNCRKRTAPQASTPSRDSDRGSPAERDALRGEHSPHVDCKRNSQAVHNGQSNGKICNVTPKGSNGHLPNTPI